MFCTDPLRSRSPHVQRLCDRFAILSRTQSESKINGVYFFKSKLHVAINFVTWILPGRIRGCRAEKASFEFYCRQPTAWNFSDSIPFGFRELLSEEVRGKASLLLGWTTVVGESFHPCCYALQMDEAGVAVHL